MLDQPAELHELEPGDESWRTRDEVYLLERELTMGDKRCGTCKYWTRSLVGEIVVSYNYNPARSMTAGTCDAPEPDSFVLEELTPMGIDEGETCPTWTPVLASLIEALKQDLLNTRVTTTCTWAGDNE